MTVEYFNRDARAADGLRAACKACQSAYYEAYNQAHAEKRRAYARAYYEAHAEEARAYYRAHYEAHSEETRAYQRAYRQAHSERVRATKQNYYQSHAEEIRARVRAYQQAHVEERRTYLQAHPERARVNNHRRRALKRGALGTHTAADVRELIAGQTDGKGRLRCWWCRGVIRGTSYHVDHRVPLSRGGTNDPANLVIACPHCNTSKGAKLPQEWAGRLL